MPAARPETPVEIGRPVALVRVTALGVPRFGVTSVGEVARTTSPVPVHVKSDDVAIAVTLPAAPVMLPRIEFAATCASLVSAVPLVARVSEPAAPPTSEPKVPEYENSEPSVAVVVATLWYADAPP